MSVPKQVQKQSEAVQKLYEDIHSNDDNASSDEGEVLLDANGKPVEPKAADSAAEPAPTPTPDEQGGDDQDEDWEQKYRTMQGMYNAEVPRLNAQAQEQYQRIEGLEAVIATRGAGS